MARGRKGGEVAGSRDQLVQMFEQSPGFMALLSGPEHRFEFANAGYVKLTGHRELNGRTVCEALPEVVEQGFIEILDRVRASGESYVASSAKVALQHTPGGPIDYRHLDFVYQPIVNDGVTTGILVHGYDVSARVEADQRRDALVQLSDRLGEVEHPADAEFEAAKVLAAALDVSRAGYGEIDPDTDILTVRRDWNAPGMQSLVGSLYLRDYGSFVDDLKRGEIVIVHDIDADPRTSKAADAIRRRGVNAFVNVPVIERGALVAMLIVNDARKRNWTPEEVAFVRDVASRTRMASERIRVAIALRESEARLRFLDRLTTEVAVNLDADAILATTTRLVGEYIGGSICAYADMDEDEDGFTIRGDWTAPGSASIVGHYSLADFGQTTIAKLSSGEPLVLNDAAAELPPHEAATFQSIGVAATICMPLLRAGKLTALMAIHSKAPRVWSENDLATIREVTERSWAHVERVRSESERTESERRYSTLFNSIDEGFCIIEFFDGPDGLDYVHVEANAAYAIHAGIPNVVGQKVREMVGAEAPGWIELYGSVLETGQPIRFERELVATGRWLEVSAYPVEPLSRRQVAVLFQDQSDKKLAELALRSSEENFRTLARAMPNQAWTAQSNGLLDWFNEQVYVYAGASVGALDGAGWTAMVHPDDVEIAGPRWAEAVKTGETYEVEFRLKRADGLYRWHIARAVPIKDEDGRVVRWIGTNTDIHEQKALAETLEQRVLEETRERMKAEEALRQSQKMESIGQLTGGIAHDFNNLLAAIGGSFSMIERRINTGKPGAERYIGAGQDAVRRAASLTQRLLAFSRRQTLDPKPIDVNKLINGMEELIQRSVGPDVEVEVVGAAGLWPTKADQSQLESALLNLCINARDAMAPKGGRLTIETANKWLDERASRERDLPPGQYISLCVTDTGTGMDADTMARAFDPFFTTKPIGQGTGLGLSMVYGFVRQSGGQVRVYSELDKGTTMCLYLPRFVGTVEASEEGVKELPPLPASGETVLVIDDEATLRMLIVDVLEEAGYRVLQAGNGPEGLRILQSKTPLDLLITDVGLPGGLNGRQVADAARVTRPDLKVLFITGYAENAAVGNGHLEAGMEVVTKPFVITDFANKVRDLIDR